EADRCLRCLQDTCFRQEAGTGAFCALENFTRRRRGTKSSADDQSVSPQGPPSCEVQDGQPCAAKLAAKARRLHARLYADAQEAELGVAQGRTRAPDQR